MPLYMTQFAYTQQAWGQMVKNPQDRLAGLKTLAAEFKAKVHSLYFSNGEYDGLAILEGPDDESVNAMLFATVAAGHIKNIKTVHLYTMDEVITSLKKANKVSYKGPS